MKSIQISQLKEEGFSCIDLIEGTLSLSKTDMNLTLNEIKEMLADVEGLREALFFKQEKLSGQLRAVKDKINENQILDLHKQLKSLKLDSLGETKIVLQRNKEIFELKLLNRVLRYTIEVEKDNYNVLTALIKSEDKDDWNFLCFYLKNTLEFFSGERKEHLLKISKDIQDKLLSVFEESKKINNKTMMKSAITALDELDNNHTLLQTYIYDMEIFQKKYSMSHPHCDEIDIELYDEENNSFLVFINDLKISYQENLLDISEIFNNYEEAYKIINIKIFDDLIFPNLDNFLQGTIPFVYLFSVESAYKNIYNLGIFIESVSVNFSSKAVHDEFVNKYSAMCIDEERAYFIEIFNKLVYGSKSITRYVYKNETIVFSKDYNYIINVLVYLINTFYFRSVSFYNEEDISDMCIFYGEYLSKFLEVVYDDIQKKLEAIYQIQQITLRIKNCFKDDYYKLDNFIKKSDKLINNALDWEIDQCKGRIKQFIGQILFYRPESDLLVLEYLKKEVFESKKIKGQPQTDFIRKIYNIAYENLKQKIFQLKFSISQKKNLINFNKKFIQTVTLTGDYQIIANYKYLENLVILITVDKSTIKEIYDSLKYKINKNDLKKAMKCRNEKDTV